MSEATGPLAPDELAALTFEAAQARLETVCEQLESGQAPLEQALELYRLGLQLRDFCRAKLEAAEAILERLAEAPDGSLTIEEADE